MTVTVSYAYHGTEPQFVTSLVRFLLQPQPLDPDLPFWIWKSYNIAAGRNDTVRGFLKSRSEWLWFVDTDQTFAPDILHRLLDSADPIDRPIMSALVTTIRDGKTMPAAVVPDETGSLRSVARPPKPRFWRCVPGTGCLLIHRTVLEAVGKEHAGPWPWFEFTPLPDGRIRSEDFTFIGRANALGFRSYVDTGIEAGHLKTVELTSSDWEAA